MGRPSIRSAHSVSTPWIRPFGYSSLKYSHPHKVNFGFIQGHVYLVLTISEREKVGGCDIRHTPPTSPLSLFLSCPFFLHYAVDPITSIHSVDVVIYISQCSIVVNHISAQRLIFKRYFDGSHTACNQSHGFTRLLARLHSC